jgi:hypothetical protein
MDTQLQERLRLLKVDLLTFLHALAVTDAIALELNEISNSTSTAESDLKGQISTLRRMKFDDASIITPAGRDNDGRLRWKINETVVSKIELAKFLEEEILGKEGLRINPK